MLYGLRQTNRTFWLVSAAFFLALAGTFGMLFHQVAYLQDLGFPAGRVAAVVGLIGITSLPARFAVPALASRVRPSRLITAVFALLALSGLTLADTEEWWRVYLYVVLFGAVFGSVLPMRAVAMSSHFSGAVYGRLMGAQQTMLAFAMAGGPFLTGLLRDTLGDYLLPWLGMSVLLASAIPLILATDRA